MTRELRRHKLREGKPGPTRAVADARPAAGRSFLLALVVGLAWPFALLYSGKASAFLLTGKWAWAPFGREAPDALAFLAALPDASPPAMLGAAILPCTVILCFARPALGRYLFGRPANLGPGRGWGPEQLPRLAGLGAALVLFLLLGGLS